MKINKIAFIAIGLAFFLIIMSFFGSRVKENVTNKSYFPSKVLSSCAVKFKKTFRFLFLVSDLQKENKVLVEKIASLEVDRTKIGELEHENSLLKKELGFVQENKVTEVVPARIIGREPTNYLNYIVVDRGKSDGIQEKATVISSGTLVGQVQEVYENSSKITLVTSKNSNILVMLQESRAKGILRGGIAGLVLEDIIQDIEIKPGEHVITSGLDGEIPEGILVGKADKIRSFSSDLFKKVGVEPIVDLSKLEIVFIVK